MKHFKKNQKHQQEQMLHNQQVYEGKVVIERAPGAAGFVERGLQPGLMQNTNVLQQQQFVQPAQNVIMTETVAAPALNTVQRMEVDTFRDTRLVTEAPTVIRHEEQALFSNNTMAAQVITHQEAPIVKTIIEQPIIKESHRDIVHEHHQNVVQEVHKDLIHEHHRPIIHEHIQPVIYQEHIHEKHIPIIHERQKEIIHEKHVNMAHESHEKRVTEEFREAIVTESRAAPVVTKEIVKPIIEKEILETQTLGTLGHHHSHGGLIQEERIIEDRTFQSGAPLGTLGHQHVDTFETDAYGTQKVGFGQKLKNKFRNMTHRNKNQEDIEQITYGPNGEKIIEQQHYEERFK